MKILVTGVNGQLGFDVVRELKNKGYQDILGVDINEMDLTKQDSVNEVTYGYKPDVIIHCAAWTAVDLAEEKKELCYDVNVNGTKYLAMCAKELNCKFVYFSTDYIYDGQGSIPFLEVDQPKPINMYGETKYLGELEVINNLSKYFICRISWVFGINGNNFIKTMLKLSKEKEELNIVSDQIGSPTYTFDLSKMICDLIGTDKFGIYHVTNEGYCSWYEFALEIFKKANVKMKVNPITSDKFPTKAKRPFNSRLSKDKLEDSGFKRLPSWQDALERYLIELEVE